MNGARLPRLTSGRPSVVRDSGRQGMDNGGGVVVAG